MQNIIHHIVVAERNMNVTQQTRMWANAQRDGRPLFNAVKFGSRPLLNAGQ